MKDFEKELLLLANEFADDYSIEDVLDTLFPGLTIGELVVDMYNHGMIPEESIEAFLES